MYIRTLLVGLAFLVSGTVNASTVFAPTDGDVNFLLEDFVTPGTILGIFDDTDTGFTNNLIVSIPEIIAFAAGGTDPGDFTATGINGSLNLVGSDHFILGILVGGSGSWSGDTSIEFKGANSYTVNFSDGSVLEVDVRVVPIPAAVWLFGSGLLGLAGVARRKKAA